MQAFGQSKQTARQTETEKDKIFSCSTYQTYWKHIKYFLKWLKTTHPECSTLKSAQKYVNEWLAERVAQGLSAWTIHTETAALCKLYQIAPDDPKRFQPPKRQRQNIMRSRGSAVRDRHFSTSNNHELIQFVRGTGTRRNVLAKLTGDDLWSRSRILAEISALKARGQLDNHAQLHLSALEDALAFFPDQDYFLHHRRDKNGKSRFAPIIGPYAPEIIARMRNTRTDELVWQYVSSNADIHGYRSDYATALYKHYARNIAKIPYDRVNRGTGKRFQSDVYTCRKDETGKKLDKAAMRKCSKALGHNRLNVVADNYLRGL
jgi:primosomal protein N''